MSGDTAEYDDAAPRAGALVESLRSFGYSPETAIADLIDNSISAGASKIDVYFVWEEESSHIAILDDGAGMDSGQLLEAMRPGSMGPTEERSKKDLGRFGLGLKTASFSQARELSVVSRSKSSATAIRCWDLDYVVETGQWRLLRTPALAAERYLDRVDEGTGTAVVWTKCDHLVRDLDVDPVRAHDRFLSTADWVARHLGMTFHRFLSGRKPISITVNQRPVVAWDPIMRHTETHAVNGGNPEVYTYGGSKVTVRPYVLPHRSKLTEQQQTEGAGMHGWTAQQGFYVYRNDRLMVAGDWLGVGGTKDEHTKLARIVVDFDSAIDLAWQIDVKKSTARPPGSLLPDFKRVARSTRKAAEEVYRFRGGLVREGSLKSREGLVMAWLEFKGREGNYKLRVNREHPVIVEARSGITEQKRAVDRVLTFLEETIPTNLIGIRMAETLDDVVAPYASDPNKLMELLVYSLEVMTKSGMARDEAIATLSGLEPFAGYPALLAAVAEMENT